MSKLKGEEVGAGKQAEALSPPEPRYHLGGVFTAAAAADLDQGQTLHNSSPEGPLGSS